MAMSTHIGGPLWEAKAGGARLRPPAAGLRGTARLHESMGLEPESGRARWPAIDAARGIAIAAMVVYHLAWDLSHVRLIATDIVAHPAWQLFARTIAASFLVLVGIGLVLGHGDGVRWRPFLRRLAVVAGAALAITVVTRTAFPEEYIFFGILHCIAVSSLLALPFLRAPLAVLAAAAAACFAAPMLLTSPALDAPYLDWLGLGSSAPITNDYVPIFPWFGFVLLGLVAGRLIRSLAASPKPLSQAWYHPLSRAFIWSGRRSLVIYLVHQPLLLGALLLLVQVTGPNPIAEEAVFRRDCEETCLGSGGAGPACAAGCACAAERLKETGLWRQVLAGEKTAADQERLSEITGQCFRQ
jgi:uncharacterized membrane protein